MAVKKEEAPIVLSVRNACKYFGGIKAVDDISLDLHEGEKKILIGTNGAGKTTLFNIITGDLKLTSGKIEMFGQDVSNLPPRKKARMGLRRTYQTSAVFDTMTVRENLYMSLLGNCSTLKQISLFKRYISDKDMMEKVEQCAEDILLQKELETKAINLSHGQRRQLEFGQALIVKPKIMMLDEPASGLSAEERVMLQEMIRGLDDKGITIIMIEHDMDIAFGIADNILVMFEGKLVVEGSPDEVKNNEVVREIYLGGRFDDKSDS